MTAILSELAIDAQLLLRGDPPPGFPTEPNTTAEVGGRTVLWLGPDEWLILGGRELDFPDAAATIDVSANRLCLQLAGLRPDDVLALGCSLDLHQAVFEPGQCAQTLLARVQVILFRVERDVWRVFARPSFATYLREWFADAIEGATG